MKTIILLSALLSGCSTLAPNTGSFGESAVNVFSIWLNLHNSPAAMASRANYMSVGMSQSQPNQSYSGITQYNQASREALNPSTPVQEVTISNPKITIVGPPLYQNQSNNYATKWAVQ
jgi:hypothetical protein